MALMPQLVICSDHTIRVSAVAAFGDGLWICTAVLTMKETGETFEATSEPCVEPQACVTGVIDEVRRLAGLSR
jgi:hypothetical protein